MAKDLEFKYIFEGCGRCVDSACVPKVDLENVKPIMETSNFSFQEGTYCIVGALGDLTEVAEFHEMAELISEEFTDCMVKNDLLVTGYTKECGATQFFALNTHKQHGRVTITEDGALVLSKRVITAPDDRAEFTGIMQEEVDDSEEEEEEKKSEFLEGSFIHFIRLLDDTEAGKARVKQLNPDVEFITMADCFYLEAVTPAFYDVTGDEDLTVDDKYRFAWGRVVLLPKDKSCRTALCFEHGTPPPTLLLPVGPLEPVFPEKTPLESIPLPLLKSLWTQLAAGTPVDEVFVEEGEGDIDEIRGLLKLPDVSKELALRTIYSTIQDWF
jgi:hypothetical protein